MWQVQRMVKNQIRWFTLKNFKNLKIFFCYQFEKMYKESFFLPPEKKKKGASSQPGVEPRIFWSVVRRVIHCATGPPHFKVLYQSLLTGMAEKIVVWRWRRNQLDRKELWILVKLMGYLRGHCACYIHLKYYNYERILALEHHVCDRTTVVSIPPLLRAACFYCFYLWTLH